MSKSRLECRALQKDAVFFVSASPGKRRYTSLQDPRLLRNVFQSIIYSCYTIRSRTMYIVLKSPLSR